jgi:hypothetical protein
MFREEAIMSRLVLVTLLICLLVGQAAKALVIKDFTSDGQIVTGDSFYTVSILSGADVSITGGTVSYAANVYGTGKLSVSGGSAPLFFNLYDSAVLDLSGCTFTETWVYLGSSTNDLINVFGHNLAVAPYYSDHTIVTGRWNEDASSTFSFVVGRTLPASQQIVLHEIPEPVTLMLLGLGGLGLDTRRARRLAHM